MAKLLTFFPCTKVVIDRTDNNVSVSDILQEISVVIPTELQPPPLRALVPSTWSVFAMWYRDADEQTTPFEVLSRFIAPDDSVLLDALPATRVTFENNTKTSQRVINTLNGFPIGAPGVCHVVLMTKSDGEGEFSELARFPILIKHLTPAETVALTASST